MRGLFSREEEAIELLRATFCACGLEKLPLQSGLPLTSDEINAAARTGTSGGWSGLFPCVVLHVLSLCAMSCVLRCAGPMPCRTSVYTWIPFTLGMKWSIHQDCCCVQRDMSKVTRRCPAGQCPCRSALELVSVANRIREWSNTVALQHNKEEDDG